MTTVVKLRVRIAVVALTIAEVDRVVSGLRIDEDLRIARQWLPAEMEMQASCDSFTGCLDSGTVNFGPDSQWPAR